MIAKNIKVEDFWTRIDNLKGPMMLKDLCKKANLDANKVMRNRCDKRLMSCADTYALACALGVSMEYLLIGIDVDHTIDAILADALNNSDEVTREMVYRILGLSYKKKDPN